MIWSWWSDFSLAACIHKGAFYSGSVFRLSSCLLMGSGSKQQAFARLRLFSLNSSR